MHPGEQWASDRDVRLSPFWERERELEALVRCAGCPNWNGPYLKKPTIPKDPWGNAYNYKCCPGDNGDYDLWTDGADGAPGGDGENADVTSWDTAQK